MKRYEFSEKEISEIKAARSKYHDPEIQKRLQALEMRAEGWTNAEVSEATGFHPAYVARLVGKYREDGLERITTLIYRKVLCYQKVRKRSYPVLITKTDCSVSVCVPDFDITVQGKNESEAVQRAQDVVSLWATRLSNYPEASEIALTEARTADNSTVSEIEIDIAPYRNRPETQLTTRSFSLPRWLDEEAKRAKLNFSSVLREALKRELFSAKDKE